jgi:hypothetical protein
MPSLEKMADLQGIAIFTIPFSMQLLNIILAQVSTNLSRFKLSCEQ